MIHLSIVLCCYNGSLMLSEALRTVAAQTDREFELLIVDDGSTDETEKIAREFVTEFSNCVYLQKPHTGLADSRNFGVRNSKGTHIGFIDSDDLWSPHYIEAMRAFLKSHPEADLVCCSGFRIDESGNVLGALVRKTIPDRVNADTCAHDNLEFLLHVTPSAMIFSRDAYEKIGEFDSRYVSGTDDIHWLGRAISKDLTLLRLNRELILYRRHARNLSNHLDLVTEAWLSIYQEHWKGHTDPRVSFFFQRVMHRNLVGLLARYSPERNRQLFRRAAGILDQDWLLRCARSLTYVGICTLARQANRIKHRFFKGGRKLGRLNLSESPQAIFSAASKITAGR